MLGSDRTLSSSSSSPEWSYFFFTSRPTSSFLGYPGPGCTVAEQRRDARPCSNSISPSYHPQLDGLPALLPIYRGFFIWSSLYGRHRTSSSLSNDGGQGKREVQASQDVCCQKALRKRTTALSSNDIPVQCPPCPFSSSSTPLISMTDFKFPFELEAWRIVQQQPTKLEVLEEDDPTHHLSDDSSAPLLPGPASRRRPSASPAEYHLPKPGLAAGISVRRPFSLHITLFSLESRMGSLDLMGSLSLFWEYSVSNPLTMHPAHSKPSVVLS